MPDFLLQTFAIIKGNVIPALIVLTAVVFVHEMGHFLVARWCGIRVAAFSIGFGRELAGFTDRRGTRWKLSAIPLGGYVRFEGDDNAASIPDAEMLAQDPAVGAPRPVPFRPAVEARRRRGGRPDRQFHPGHRRLCGGLRHRRPAARPAAGGNRGAEQRGGARGHQAGRPDRQRRRRPGSIPSRSCRAS